MRRRDKVAIIKFLEVFWVLVNIEFITSFSPSTAMGKAKRQRLAGNSSKKQFHPSSKKATSGNLNENKKTTNPLPKKPVQIQHSAPTIPFKKDDRILLVGEGDLSLAASLVRSHECLNITATVFERSREELEGKYPSVGENIAVIEDWGTDRYQTIGDHTDGEAAQDSSLVESKGDLDLTSKPSEGLTAEEWLRTDTDVDFPIQPRIGKVLYNIDAMKMGPYHDVVAKAQGRGKLGAFDSIQFHFPHVGGKSTDINRQVRYNQELLVAFFKRAILSLAPKGSIIVTLFEGQPYELWCIRNLARHVGLAVERSFVFQASAYPGYKHARTLGVIRNKKGEISGGGWKGEERPSRSYIFRRKDEVPTQGEGKKRKAESDDEGGYDD